MLEFLGLAGRKSALLRSSACLSQWDEYKAQEGLFFQIDLSELSQDMH